MWDDFFEIILEGILEISIDAAGRKGKGILIGVAAVVWLAVTVLLLWIGIAQADITLIGLGAMLLAALVFLKIERYCRSGK